MPKGDRAKELSFRLWKEGKSLAEIQAQICGDSKTLQENVKQWVAEWERGRQATWKPEISNWVNIRPSQDRFAPAQFQVTAITSALGKTRPEAGFRLNSFMP